MIKRCVIGSIVLVVATAVVAVCWCDAGGSRTRMMLALDRYERAQRPPKPPPRPGRLPDCGAVYPEIETWPPEDIDDMVFRNPDSRVAHVWAILAYRRQQRWADLWAVADVMEARWPGNAIVRDLYAKHEALRIPLPAATP